MKKIKNNEQAQQFFEVRDRLNAIADLARDIFSDGETRELIELMADIKNWLVIDEI